VTTLVRIEPAPPGDEGVRLVVTLQDGSTESWKALAVEIVLDTTPGDERSPEASLDARDL